MKKRIFQSFSIHSFLPGVSIYDWLHHEHDILINLNTSIMVVTMLKT